MALQRHSGQRNEELFPVPSPEKKTDPQTLSPTHRVALLATQPDSHPLDSASAPEATPLPAPELVSDFKRQNETALSWSYVLIAISFTLRVNSPNQANSHNLAHFPELIVLCAATAILEYLCLFTAVGIFYYSSTGQLSADLAKAQKTVLTSSKLILLLDFLCRLALRFPFLPFLPITVAAAANWIILLYLFWRFALRFPFLAIAVALTVLAPSVLFPLDKAATALR